MSNQADFFDMALPYASQASEALKIPTSVILSQWALESAYGTSGLAGVYNLGGIKYSTKGYGQKLPSGFASYASFADFTRDYIRVLKLPYYDDVRGKTDVVEAVRALAASPYDAGHYHGTGDSLLKIIKQYNLTKYDDLSVAFPDDVGALPDPGGWNITLPKGIDSKIAAWGLIAAGVILMIGVLGGSVPEVKRGDVDA